ncbi:MAG: hypothetical protein JEY94_03890 [Melioribacteraceae bacterium]|nr:hypothetical protein [Melioribacteraceae bacterium]
MKKVTLKIVLLLFFSSFILADNPQEFKILIINSYHQNSPWTSEILNGLMENLEPEFPGSEIYIENLDTKRFFSEEYINNYDQLLTQKYKSVDLDIIIISDNNALDYLLKKSSFDIENIPKVFCGINHFDDKILAEYKLIYGVPEKLAIEENIELIKKLNPDLRELTLVTDITVTGKAIKKDFMQAIENYDLSIKYLDSLRLKDLIKNLESKSDKDVVIYSVFNKDIDQKYYVTNVLLDFLKLKTTAQFFSFNDFNFGHGIIGGKLLYGYGQGKAAAEIAKRILTNKTV